MNLTVYLPDDLGRRAQEAGLKGQYSHLLQLAIQEELDKIEKLEKHRQGEFTEIELELEDCDGNAYIGTIEGREVGEAGISTVYLDVDGRVFVHCTDPQELLIFESVNDPDLPAIFSGLPSEFADEARATAAELGIKPRMAL